MSSINTGNDGVKDDDYNPDNELMIIKINFGKDKYDMVYVMHHDNIDNLALKFVKKNKLKSTAIPVIRAHIAKTVEEFIKENNIKNHNIVGTNFSSSELQNTNGNLRDFISPTIGDRGTSPLPENNPFDMPPNPLLPSPNPSKIELKKEIDDKPTDLVKMELKKEVDVKSSSKESIDHQVEAEVNNFINDMLSNRQVSEESNVDSTPKNFNVEKIENEIVAAEEIFQNKPTIVSSSQRKDSKKSNRKEKFVSSSNLPQDRDSISNRYEDSTATENNNAANSIRNSIESIPKDPKPVSPSRVRSSKESIEPQLKSSQKSKSMSTRKSVTRESVESISTGTKPTLKTKQPIIRESIDSIPTTIRSQDSESRSIKPNKENVSILKRKELKPRPSSAPTSSMKSSVSKKLPLDDDKQIVLKSSSKEFSHSSRIADLSNVSATERLYIEGLIAHEMKMDEIKKNEERMMKELSSSRFKMNSVSKKIVASVPRKDKDVSEVIYNRLYEESKYLVDYREHLESVGKVSLELPMDWSCVKCGTLNEYRRRPVNLYTYLQSPTSTKDKQQEILPCKSCGFSQTTESQFVPRISNHAMKSKLKSNDQQVDDIIEKKDIYSRLYDDRYNRDDEIMQSILQSVYRQEYTFQPKISKVSQKIIKEKQLKSGIRSASVTLPIHDRLFEQHYEKLRAERVATYQLNKSPIKTKVISNNHVDQLVDRLAKEKQNKEEKLERMRMYYHHIDLHTGQKLFQPLIEPNLTIDKQDNNNVEESISTSVFDKLSEEAHTRKKRLDVCVSDKEIRQYEYFTNHKPTALTKSDKILKHANKKRMEEMYRLLLATNEVIEFHKFHQIEANEEELSYRISEVAEAMHDWKQLPLNLQLILSNSSLLIPDVRNLLYEVNTERVNEIQVIYATNQNQVELQEHKDDNMNSHTSPTTNHIMISSHSKQSKTSSPGSSIISASIRFSPSTEHMNPNDFIIDFNKFSSLVFQAISRREGSGKSYIIAPKKRDDVNRELIQKQLQEFTFTPAICLKSRSLSKQRKIHQSGIFVNESNDMKLNDKSNPSIFEVAASNDTSGLTLTTRNDRKVKMKSFVTYEDTQEKLYKLAFDINKKLERRRQEKLDKEMEACSFHPKLYHSSVQPRAKPIKPKPAFESLKSPSRNMEIKEDYFTLDDPDAHLKNKAEMSTWNNSKKTIPIADIPIKPIKVKNIPIQSSIDSEALAPYSYERHDYQDRAGLSPQKVMKGRSASTSATTSPLRYGSIAGSETSSLKSQSILYTYRHGSWNIPTNSSKSKVASTSGLPVSLPPLPCEIMSSPILPSETLDSKKDSHQNELFINDTYS